tara:strand:+ start:77 stop:1369 length:1293 start_codon:yes stop_codon:yes gene_type:complete
MLSVHQHWDPLKVCAVGRCYPPEYFNYIQNSKVRGVFHRIAEETEEDYQKLISVLNKFDVKVIRTDITDNPEDYRRSDGTMMSPPMVPRDYTAMVGSKFFMPGKNFGKNIDIEWELKCIMNTSSLHMKNISDFHKDLLNYVYDLTFPGRPVSSSTQSMLLKTLRGMKAGAVGNILQAIDTEDLKNVIFQGHTNTIGKTSKYVHNDKTYPFKTLEKFVTDSGNEIVYDQYINSASMIRLGKDLYFALGNIISKMNEDNFMKKWKKLFPDYNIHPISTPGHSDGTMCPVKPGLILSLRDPEFYKESFPGWEVVTLEGESWHKVKPFMDRKVKTRGRYWVPDADDSFYDFVNEWMDDWVTYVEETVFDLNMLVIDENNVICNNVNEKAFDAFERHGITPHIVNFRHRYFWDGGLHCITSDISREGEQKSILNV